MALLFLRTCGKRRADGEEVRYDVWPTLHSTYCTTWHTCRAARSPHANPPKANTAVDQRKTPSICTSTAVITTVQGAQCGRLSDRGHSLRNLDDPCFLDHFTHHPWRSKEILRPRTPAQTHRRPSCAPSSNRRRVYTTRSRHLPKKSFEPDAAHPQRLLATALPFVTSIYKERRRECRQSCSTPIRQNRVEHLLPGTLAQAPDTLSCPVDVCMSKLETIAFPPPISVELYSSRMCHLDYAHRETSK